MKDLSIFEQIRGERDDVANIHRAFEDFPEGVAAHFLFYKSIVLAEGLPLSRVEREFLAVKTSEANRCPYCIAHHQTALENSNPGSIAKERAAALALLAETLTKEAWKASSVKKSFLLAGLSDADWQHAVMVVAYFNFANRCAHAMNLELEPNFQATCK